MSTIKKGAVVVCTLLAANRMQFFSLVRSLEREAGCRVDTIMLEAAIDSNYPGQDSLTPEEAACVLRACTPARKSETPR